MYKVLLVEDDIALRFIYRNQKCWEEYGFKIEAEATNGEEALLILRKQKMDLVVTDIQMPIMDGVQLLQAMRNNDDQTTTVFVSSHQEFEYARQGMLLGVIDFIIKPLEQKQLEEVLIRVRNTLDERSKKNIKQKLPIQILSALGDTCQNDEFLKKISLYLIEHVEENITMTDVANYMKLNKDYLGKTIKKKYGESFVVLLNHIKIEYAKYLIKKENYKTYEVSEKLGYASVDYFTKLFKQTTGMTPGKYKKE